MAGCVSSTFTGTHLSQSDLTQLASNAGFKGDALNTIVAIAMRESGGWTNAQCVNTDGSKDNGVLQFNDHQPPVNITPEQANDPQTAFNAAYAAVYGTGRGFQPWSVNLFPSDPVTGSVNGNPGNLFNTTASDAVQSAADSACNGTRILNFLGAQGICVPKNIWQRFGFGTLGFGLILLGAVGLIFYPEIGTALGANQAASELQTSTFIHRDKEGRVFGRETATRRVKK